MCRLDDRNRDTKQHYATALHNIHTQTITNPGAQIVGGQGNGPPKVPGGMK